MKLVLIYLCAVNALTFLMYWADKHRARHSRSRVPERVLLWLAALGGSPAALAAMYLCRHKTRKRKFFIGVPAMLVVQLATAVLAVYEVYVK